MSIRASQTLQTTINFTFTEGGETLDIAGLSLGFEVRGATSFGMSATGGTGQSITIIPDGGLSTLDPAVYDGIVEVEGYSPVFVPVSVEKVNTNYVNNVTISYEPTAFDTTTAAPSEFVQSWNGEAGIVDFTQYTSSVNGETGAVEVAESNQVTLNYEVNNLGFGDPVPETIGAMTIKESLDKLYFYKIDSNNKDLRATFIQNTLTSGRITLSQKGKFAEWTYTTSAYDASDGIWTVDYDYTNGVTFATGDDVSVQIFPDNTSFAGVSGEYDYLKVNQFIEFGDGTTQGSASTGSGSGEVESVNGLTGAVSINAGTNMTVTNGAGGITLDAAGGAGGGETAERIEQDIQADGKVFANDPVYITGAVGASGRLTVARADASDPSKMPAAGIVTETIENGVNGTMLTIGNATGLNTSAFDTGDTVYVASGFGLTNVKPTGATNLIQNMGKVGRDDNNTGEIFITGAGRANDTPNLIHARAGISADAGITFPDGTYQATAATTSASGVDSVNGLSGDVVFNAGTNMTITTGAGGITLDAAGGSGGSSNYWISNPDNTDTWKLFDDLLSDEPLIASLWVSSAVGQPWSWYSNSQDGNIIGGYRVAMGTLGGARGGLVLPKLGKDTPADGDEFLAEIRARILIGLQAGQQDPYFQFGVQLGDANSQDAVGPVYGNDPRAGIFVGWRDHTQWRSYISDSTSSQNPTRAAFSSPVSWTDNTTHQCAVHAVYDGTASAWDMDWYLNGTLVHSSTLTQGSGTPFVRFGMSSDGEGAASNYDSRYVEFDWIQMQYTRPATVTHLDIEDL